MRLEAVCAGWEKFWDSTSDSAEVERQMRKLRWLEDFAFHCGAAIGVEQYRALRIQIEVGEKKLIELQGAFAVPASQPQQPDWVNR